MKNQVLIKYVIKTYGKHYKLKNKHLRLINDQLNNFKY